MSIIEVIKKKKRKETVITLVKETGERTANTVQAD